MPSAKPSTTSHTSARRVISRRSSTATTANTTPAAKWSTWLRIRASTGTYAPPAAPMIVRTTGTREYTSAVRKGAESMSE